MHGTALLIEDSRVARVRLSALLEGLGCSVVGVGSAEEALELPAAATADVVLCDVHLPGIDGFELCRRLRRREGEGPAVVMMTGSSDPAHVLRGLEAGAQGFLRKDLDDARLSGRLETLLARVVARGDSGRVVFDGEEFVVRSDPGAILTTLTSSFEDVLDLSRAVAERERRAEETLAGVLDTVPVGILVCDGRGRLLRCNGAAEELLGARPTGVCDAAPTSATLADGVDRPSVPLALARRDGSVVHVLASTRASLRADGTVEQVVTTLTSVDALRQARGQFRRLFELAPVAMAVVRDGRVVAGNEALGRDLERPHLELAGSPLAELTGAPPGALEELLGSPPAGVERLEWQDERGRRRAVEVQVAAIEHEGEPAAMVVWREVTRRIEVEAQLRLADRLANVGTVAAAVAHEINNPLTYVLGNLVELAEELEAAASGSGALDHALLAELLGDAREGAERVKVIVRDLGSFARTEAGERSVLDPHAVVRRAVRMARMQLQHHAVVVTELGPVPPVLGHAGELVQVLLNLLVNASHAIQRADGDLGRVVVRTRDEGGAVVIEVEDDGCGIAPEHLERIFDPFFTTKSAEAGSGLGLAICADILRGHGGSIGCRSVPGVGTTFELRLPGAPDEPIAAPAAAPARPEPSWVAPEARVLVIDDDDKVREALRRALGSAWEVVDVPSGAAAVALLHAGAEFDALVCDVMMPGLSGIDVHAWLCDHRPDLERQSLFLTGGAVTPEARAFAASMGDRLVRKPVEPAELRSRVAGVLELARP